jgi:hypothetical protein
MRVDKELRDATNRWGKEANAKLGVARLDMGDTHTTLESIMPLILEFSRALQMMHHTSRDALFLPGRNEGGFMQVGIVIPFQTRITNYL